MKKTALILLINFICLQLFSIDSKYVVFRITGKVYFGNINNKRLINKGDTIIFDNKDKALIIDKSSGIIFYNLKGKFFGINKEGSYFLTQLDSYSNNNLTSKYFTYVWEEMNHKTHKEDLNVSAGISRGKKNKNILMNEPPDSCKILTNEIKFEWDNYSTENKKYFFYIYNYPPKFKGNLLYEKVLTQPSFTFKIDSTIFKKGHKYCWFVDTTTVVNLKSELWIFELADKKWINEFNRNFASFKKDFKTDDEYKYLSLAFFCYNYKVFPLAKYFYSLASGVSKNDAFIEKAGVIFK